MRTLKPYTTLRNNLKINFLNDFFHNKKFEIYPIPADASYRTYDRIISGNHSFILMNSPPEYYNLNDFIKIGEFLLKAGFSAPEIFSTDRENGFLLLEDFGDNSVGKYLLDQQAPQDKLQIYQIILELLSKLHNFKQDTLKLNFYTNELLLKELELYTDWYVPFASQHTLNDEQKAEFFAIWTDILKQQPKLNSVIVLRDYHVENMMILDRVNIKSIGLLDFQDAILGSPFYDVVSVLEDARFQVDKDFAYSCLDYFLKLNPHLDKNHAYLSYHVLGAQRNSRILGVFARKAQRDKQQHYLKYLPRVEKYLDHDLSCDILKPIKNWINKNL